MPLHSVPWLPFGCNQRDALPYIALSLVRVLTPLALPARIAARPVEACPLDVRGLVTRRPCAAGLLALRCLPRGERSRLASMYCRGLRLQSRGRLSAGLPKRCGAPCFFTRTVPWTRGIAGERSTSRTASRMRGSEDGSEEERGSRAGGLTACAGLDPAGAALAKAQFLSTRGSRSATMAQGADHAQSPWTACGPESGRASWGAVGRRPRGRGSRSRYGVEAARAKRSVDERGDDTRTGGAAQIQSRCERDRGSLSPSQAPGSERSESCGSGSAQLLVLAPLRPWSFSQPPTYVHFTSHGPGRSRCQPSLA